MFKTTPRNVVTFPLLSQQMTSNCPVYEIKIKNFQETNSNRNLKRKRRKCTRTKRDEHKKRTRTKPQVVLKDAFTRQNYAMETSRRFLLFQATATSRVFDGEIGQPSHPAVSYLSTGWRDHRRTPPEQPHWAQPRSKLPLCHMQPGMPHLATFLLVSLWWLGARKAELDIQMSKIPLL